MPLLKEPLYALSQTPKTRIYIETGTYLGFGIRDVMEHYDIIHSIELSQKWYDYNVEQFKQFPHIQLHLGDTKNVLPTLLQDIHEPVTIYLDAHYSGGETAFGEEECPLLYELDFLSKRPYNDIIIIDDCRLLGKTGVCGIPNDTIYPEMRFDWSNVTEERIIKLIKNNYSFVYNEHHQFSTGSIDQMLLIPNK